MLGVTIEVRISSCVKKNVTLMSSRRKNVMVLGMSLSRSSTMSWNIKSNSTSGKTDFCFQNLNINCKKPFDWLTGVLWLSLDQSIIEIKKIMKSDWLLLRYIAVLRVRFQFLRKFGGTVKKNMGDRLTLMWPPESGKGSQTEYNKKSPGRMVKVGKRGREGGGCGRQDSTL